MLKRYLFQINTTGEVEYPIPNQGERFKQVNRHIYNVNFKITPSNGNPKDMFKGMCDEKLVRDILKILVKYQQVTLDSQLYQVKNVLDSELDNSLTELNENTFLLLDNELTKNMLNQIAIY